MTGLVLAFGWLGELVASQFGATWTGFDYRMLADLQTIGVTSVLLYLGLWVSLVPMPLGTVEISPLGLTVDSGLRRERFPWTRVHRVGRHIYTIGRWVGWPNRYVMTTHQTSRVAAFLPG